MTLVAVPGTTLCVGTAPAMTSSSTRRSGAGSPVVPVHLDRGGSDGAAHLDAETARDLAHLDTTLGEYMLDVAVAQSEAEIERDGLLDDDSRNVVATV